MENSKKRKSEETSINMDPSVIQNILHNQEKMISYIYQIGSISENTYHTLGNMEQKIEDLKNRIVHLETKNVYLENSLNKLNHTFIQELKNKDSEIESLKQLNKNIIEDYNALIQSNNYNSNEKKDNSSFYL
jgi:hypothetical protein